MQRWRYHSSKPQHKRSNPNQECWDNNNKNKKGPNEREDKRDSEQDWQDQLKNGRKNGQLQETFFPTKEDTQKEKNTHLKSAYELCHNKKLTDKKIWKTNWKKKQRTKAEINEKWVHNLSKRTLTETKKKGLGQGLNFAIRPRRIPHEEYILATELVCQKNPGSGTESRIAERSRRDTKNSKTTQNNITKEEKKAIDTLKKD